MKTNLEDKKFIEAVKNLEEGDTFKVDDGVLVVEGKFTKPTHFPFHQRIFSPGVILKKENSNVRIFIEAEKLGMKIDKIKDGEYEDRQIKNGKVLPADRGVNYKK